MGSDRSQVFFQKYKKQLHNLCMIHAMQTDLIILAPNSIYEICVDMIK